MKFMPIKLRLMSIQICIVCSKPFPIPRCRQVMGLNKMCSNACRIRNHALRIRGSGNPMFGRKQSPETIRKIIARLAGVPKGPQRPAHRRKISIANMGKIFSKETRLKMSLAKRGPNWDKARYLPEQIRGLFEYRQWRSDIFHRDNFACVLCRAIGYLNADHFPISFASLLRKHEITSIDQAVHCAELWSLNNGRTLCLACHKKTDTYMKPLSKHPQIEVLDAAA